jgi:molybdenum cofactor cytidylyltransferase
MIVGIILSAGESKRMGMPKQLLPWGKTIVLQQVIENADSSRLGQLLVVLGHLAGEIAGKITVSSKTHILVNQDFRDGMSSSVKCGIKNASADAEAFMLLLGDQPFISTNVIDKLIDSYRAGRHGIVIPVYDGHRGHPVIFDLRYKGELLSIRDQGAREVIHKHAQDTFEVCVDSPNVLNDIDTPQDYQEAKKQTGE